MLPVFEAGLNCDFAGFSHESHTTIQTAHGRTTERSYEVIEIPRDHPQRRKWRDLRPLVVATSRVVMDEKET